MKTKINIKAKRITIIILCLAVFICSFLAILFAVFTPDKSIVGSNTAVKASAQAVATDEDLQFFLDQDPYVKFGVKADVEISSANLNNYVNVTNNRGETINISYSNSYVCAPNGGYIPGEGYTISLKNGAKFTDERIHDKSEFIFIIHKDEVFESEIKSDVIVLSQNDYVSFDGDSQLVLKNGNYKTGDILQFVRTDDYGEPAIVKVVSSSPTGSGAIYAVESPNAEEVFDTLEISQDYPISEDDIEINQEGLDELIGELEEIPVMSSLGYDYTRFKPLISIDVSRKEGGVSAAIEFRFKLNNLWTDNKKACAKELARMLQQFCGDKVTKSLNVYLVLRVEITNKIDAHQEVELSSGNFIFLTTNTTTTRVKFCLEVDGAIVNISDDAEMKNYGIGKEEYKDISELLNSIIDAYDSRKEVKLANVHVTYMGIIGAGIEVNLVFSLNFKGEIGIDHSVTTVQQTGVMKTGSGTKPLENKTSKTSNTSIYALGIARAEFGLKIDASFDFMYVFKVGVRLEAGIYAELGGAFSVAWGNSEIRSGNAYGKEDKINYDQKIYTAFYFEAGIYFRASVFAQLNFFIGKLEWSYAFLDIEIPLIQVGNKECVSIILNEGKTYAMEDGKFIVPEIWISKYNIFTGERSLSLATDKDLIIQYSKEYPLMQDEDGNFIDVSGKVDAEYNVGIGALDYKFSNVGTGVNIAAFGNSVLKVSDNKEAIVADSVELKIIKEPKDIENFEIVTIGETTEIELGASVALQAINIAPTNATFSDVKFEMKSDIEGVTLDGSLLTVSSEIQAGQKIIIGAITTKNRKEQVRAQDLVLLTKEVPLSSLSVFPYREDGSEFNGGTYIPVGAAVELSPIPYPESAKIISMYYEIKDGGQYVQNATGNIITSNKIYIADDITSNCKVALVAHAINLDGEEIISKPLILEIKVNAIDSLKIYSQSSIVHRSEQIPISVEITPASSVLESIEYYIVGGQNFATVNSDGVITVNSDAILGGTIAVMAVADGVESNTLYFTVSEVYAKNIEATFFGGSREVELYYGDTAEIIVNIYPLNVTNADYEYEIISGNDDVIFDSFLNLVTLKYNVNPNTTISFRIKKILFDGTDTVIYSDVLTVKVLTVPITDFYVLPAIQNIMPGEEYHFDFSFTENAVDKQTQDYLINWEYLVTLGQEYAEINSDGKLVIDADIAQLNYVVVIRCTLMTISGVYSKDITLYCKVAADDVIIGAETQKVETSDKLQFGVKIYPSSSCVSDISYEIVKGNAYGSIDKNGLLTVYDMNSVGQTIEVRAKVISIGIDDTTGEEYHVEKYSNSFAIDISEKPIDNITFDTATPTLVQGGCFQFVASVYPANATYKLVNYSLENADNCATIGNLDGLLSISQNAKVGTKIKVIAKSPFNDEVVAKYEVTIEKASLISFDITFSKNANKPLITMGDKLTLSTSNQSPDYYEFDDGEVEYYIVSGNATISGNILTVNSGLSELDDTVIKVRAVASGITSEEMQIEITLLWWQQTKAEVERGEQFEILAGMCGNDGGYTIEYLFEKTQSHTSQYGEISSGNLVSIYETVSGGTTITLLAVIGNIEIPYTVKVKEIDHVEFATIIDANNNSITPFYENSTYSTALLHSAYRINNSLDSIQLSVKAYLSNGNIASPNSYRCNYTATYNESYVTIAGNTVSLTSDAISGGYATVKAIVSEGAASRDINVYCFVPAYNVDSGNVNFNLSGRNIFKLSNHLIDGESSTLSVPENIQNDESAYKSFLKGDTYDFGTYLTCSNRALNPTTLSYSVSTGCGNISSNGIWTAATNQTGGNSFTVTVSAVNTYMGRKFGEDFSRDCTFKMPTYIYNQSGLISLTDSSGDYYLRNDITLSGYWTPIETFSGTFDGGGHSISNIMYKVNDREYQTHFGFVRNNRGNINNLIIHQSTITINNYGDNDITYGGIAVYNYGIISYCEAIGDISLTNTDSAIGGLVWANQSGIIKFSNNRLNIKTENTICGICYSNNGEIQQCNNYGELTSLYSYTYDITQ